MFGSESSLTKSDLSSLTEDCGFVTNCQHSPDDKAAENVLGEKDLEVKNVFLQRGLYQISQCSWLSVNEWKIV